MEFRELYQKIAEHYEVSESEVEREIEIAITDAFTNPHNDKQITQAQQQVPRRGEIPTPEELILYLCKQMEERC